VHGRGVIHSRICGCLAETIPANPLQWPRERGFGTTTKRMSTWNWLTHDAAGLFTALLVVVGAVQIGVFLKQLRLIRESLAPAKAAAEAAKESARAAHRAIGETEKRDIVLHRAYVSGGGLPARRIIEIHSTATDRVSRSSALTGDFEIHMNNHGMTPAELMQIAIEFCDSAKIPPEPTYHPEPFHDWLGPGTQSRPMLWRKIPTDKPASAIYGRLYYRDIFGKNRSSGFIQSILPDGGSAPLLAPPAYTAYD
jgi:hypothetical protein